MAEKKKEEKNKVSEKKSKDAELQEIKELLQRTQANFENYRKQTEQRNEEIKEFATKDIILQVLPILDNFELALKNVDHEDHDNFIKVSPFREAEITVGCQYFNLVSFFNVIV